MTITVSANNKTYRIQRKLCSPQFLSGVELDTNYLLVHEYFMCSNTSHQKVIGERGSYAVNDV